MGILNLKSWKWIDHSYMLKDIHYVDQLTDLASESGQIVSFISQVNDFPKTIYDKYRQRII